MTKNSIINVLLWNYISYIYNLIFSKILFYKKFKIKGNFIKIKKFINKGKNLKIHIKGGGRLKNCNIINYGNNNIITMDKGVRISNTTFWFVSDNNTINIGKDFSMESGEIAALEGKKIIIGDDCMFSNNISLRTGDSHPIYSMMGEKINNGSNIIIGDHVWLCEGVTVLKGSSIPNNSVVGVKSLVNKKLDIEDSIYVGCPVKLKKRNIEWKRK